MGGHAGGQEASQLAVRVLRDKLEPLLKSENTEKRDLAADLKEAVLEANRAIFERNEGSGGQGRERSGTTVVALLLANKKAWLIHVGDSRAYLTTGAGTRLLTTDHNVGNREIGHGADPDQAWERGDADQLTQALGPFQNDYLRPDVRCFSIDEDCLFLLCSDGVSDNDFIERQETDLLRPLTVFGGDLEQGCEKLINSANNANGHDNLTAVLVRVLQLKDEAKATSRASDTTVKLGRRGLFAWLRERMSGQSR
jgi:protein phosphatase